MTLLNRMGHCESYSYSLELDTALAQAVLVGNSLLNSAIIRNPCPSVPVPGAAFFSWWDNFGANTASGSIHTALGIYAQEPGESQYIPPTSDQPNAVVARSSTNRKRSLDKTLAEPTIPPYYKKGGKQKFGPRTSSASQLNLQTPVPQASHETSQSEASTLMPIPAILISNHLCKCIMKIWPSYNVKNLIRS